MKPLGGMLLALGFGLVASAPQVKGFQSDEHFDTTFAIALGAGWSWDEASLIAGTDQAVDENVDARPSIQISERSARIEADP